MDLPPIRTRRRLVEPLWGGRRLASWLRLPEPHPESLGESWQVYGSNLIVGGPYAGQSLADLTVLHGPAFVGLRTINLKHILNMQLTFKPFSFISCSIHRKCIHVFLH